MTTMPEATADSVGAPQNQEVLVEVNDLKMYFPVSSGMLFQRTVAYVKAVDGVSFTVKRGETLGLVGESGCGAPTRVTHILWACSGRSPDWTFPAGRNSTQLRASRQI